MLRVKSDLTGKLEPCTIQPGVVGVDGVRRGAMADIDCYGMFEWEDGSGDVDIVRVYLEEQAKKSGVSLIPDYPPTDDEIEMMREQVEMGENVGRRIQIVS